MLRAMLDPEGQPASTPPPDDGLPDTEPPAPPANDWPATQYWAAIGQPAPAAGTPAPAAVESPPAPPTWTKTYELPTARKVVSSGLQLAVGSSAAVRRASIYIGLLALGAFGPAVILLLLGIGRLMSDPATAEIISRDPSLLFFEQPELAGPLTLIYALVGLGLILLVAISIDAQAMAIAILGGHAADRPLRLQEAIIRARQVFWRLLGSGLVVGFSSTLITLVVTVPFLKPFDSNQGVTFIGSMIGTLVVTPFAFAATGIVLGDVGAVEALRRSMHLFGARPRIAFVVVLFTLVTSAIQTFAIGAGLDVAVRVAEFLHLGLGQGGVSLVLPAILVLAFVVAFGSLTFTIAAIVAAPQVAAFLGLTFYSGGLDRARIEVGAPPRRFRWVTLPMLASMIGLLALAGVGLPSVTGFQPRAASPLLTMLRTTAGDAGEHITAVGSTGSFEDEAGDQRGPGEAPSSDLLGADYGYLPDVPVWLLQDLFDCSAPEVTCPRDGSEATSFFGGAVVFLQRMAGGPETLAAGQMGEWGPTMAVFGSQTGATLPSVLFPWSSHAVITRRLGADREVVGLVYDGTIFVQRPTRARSRWIGRDLLTIVPLSELPDFPERWDVYAADGAGAPRDRTRDTLRSDDAASLLEFGDAMYFAVPLAP